MHFKHVCYVRTLLKWIYYVSSNESISSSFSHIFKYNKVISLKQANWWLFSVSRQASSLNAYTITTDKYEIVYDPPEATFPGNAHALCTGSVGFGGWREIDKVDNISVSRKRLYAYFFGIHYGAFIHRINKKIEHASVYCTGLYHFWKTQNK